MSLEEKALSCLERVDDYLNNPETKHLMEMIDITHKTAQIYATLAVAENLNQLRLEKVRNR